MVDIETRSYDQLPEATALTPDDLLTMQGPDAGPLKKISVRKAFQLLQSCDIAVEAVADLTTDAGAIALPVQSLAVVYANPDGTQSGYWVKTSAAGSGTWALTDIQYGNAAGYASQAEVAAAAAAAFGNFKPGTLIEAEALTEEGERFSISDAGTLVAYFRTDVGSTEIARSVTPQSLQQPSAASGIGVSTGRNLQAELDLLRLPPSGDTTGVTDTRAMRALTAVNLPFRIEDFDGTNPYFLLGDITKDIPNGSGAQQITFGVMGNPAAPAEQQPRVIVKKGGVSPFPCSWTSSLIGVAVEYEDVADVPAVSGQTWPYARCVTATGTISTVGGKLRLTVPAGGLIGPNAEFPNVTRGSFVVALNDPAKWQDYWVNNYVGEDSIFQIDAVISDTECTLQGKNGTAYTGPIHVRGNVVTTIWNLVQPTAVRVQDCHFGAVPGCGIVTMGTQFAQFERNYILGIGAPHLRMIYAGNGQGLNFDNGQGGGWGNGGVYHQSIIRENRAFFACGGFALNGLIDSIVANLQIDPNALPGFTQHPAIDTYFTPPTALHNYAAFVNVNPTNITAEDSPADGIYLFQCSKTYLINPHTFDLGTDAYPVTIHACADSGVVNERLDPGTHGDPAKQIRYVGQSDQATSEVLLDRPTRHKQGSAVYQQGVFGSFVRKLDQRDARTVRLYLAAATLKASSAGSYIIDVPAALFDGFAGYTEFKVTGVGFDHSAVWVGGFAGTPPDLQCGTPSDPDYLFGSLSLGVAGATYRKQSAITGFSPTVLPGSTSIRFTITAGDGGTFNNGIFDCSDLFIWVSIEGYTQ